MKKTIVSLAAGFVFAGTAATGVSAQEYQVQEGDTLSGLSQEFDVSVDDLKAWNDLDSDLIVVDEFLDIQDEDDAVGQDQESVNVQEQSDAVETNEVESVEQEPKNTPSEPVEEQEGANEEETQPDAVENNESEQDEDNEADGETMTMSATAYTADCEGCSGTTTDGTDLNGDENVIAVDPDEIPLGTEVHVEGYGDAVAGDTGGDINGDRIDLHMEDKEEANEWGNQDVEVTVKE